jgi:hypothetical protein
MVELSAEASPALRGLTKKLLGEIAKFEIVEHGLLEDLGSSTAAPARFDVGLGLNGLGRWHFAVEELD